MLDFTPIRDKETTWEEFTAKLTKEDLVKQANQMTHKVLELVADCGDGDVVFHPTDPDASGTAFSTQAVLRSKPIGQNRAAYHPAQPGQLQAGFGAIFSFFYSKVIYLFKCSTNTHPSPSAVAPSSNEKLRVSSCVPDQG